MLKLKNLELNRETLRTLNVDEQAHVQGGGTTTNVNCHRCSSDSASSTHPCC